MSRGLVAGCRNLKGTGTIERIGNTDINLGGIVGRNEGGVIIACYNQASLTAKEGNWAGGLVGYSTSPSVLYTSYNIGAASGDFSAGLIGCNADSNYGGAYHVFEKDAFWGLGDSNPIGKLANESEINKKFDSMNIYINKWNADPKNEDKPCYVHWKASSGNNPPVLKESTRT